MISSLFHSAFYDPLYNLLVFVINHVPGGDVGLATIIVTCLVKLVLFPLSSIFAGLAQFVQIRLSVPAYTPPANPSKNPSFSDDLAKSMNVQMRYVMPVIMFFVCLSVSGAVALYWITGSIFTIGQELYFRKNIKKEEKKA